MTWELIYQLNSFLRGEIAAVETYRQALAKVTEIRARTELGQCLASHQTRVDMLRTRIEQLGGTPVESSGAWGAFAKTAEGGAAIFGEKAAIDVLEQGEDHGLKDYQSRLSQLDPDSRSFVEQLLLPEQSQTHRTMSALKHAIH